MRFLPNIVWWAYKDHALSTLMNRDREWEEFGIFRYSVCSPDSFQQAQVDFSQDLPRLNKEELPTFKGFWSSLGKICETNLVLLCGHYENFVEYQTKYWNVRRLTKPKKMDLNKLNSNYVIEFGSAILRNLRTLNKKSQTENFSQNFHPSSFLL